MKQRQSLVERAANALALSYTIDRLLKLAAIAHFFRRPPPPAPEPWPSVTLIQPLTRTVNDLPRALATRATLDYPADVYHLFICDAHDITTQAVCNAWRDANPQQHAQLILVESPPRRIASKVAKLQAAIPHARGDILCFVDDDILLRPDALATLVPYLFQPRVGAVFGLACYTDWHNLWSSLMSAFVNANGLLSYIPLTYLTDPFTITGHCYALRRAVFDAVSGFDNMAAHQIDDDHELARRISRAGLLSPQTPMVYDAENSLASRHAYRAQMKRWFLFPREALLPGMSRNAQALTFAGSSAGLIPPLLGLMALLSRRSAVWRALALTLGLGLAIYLFCETVYLRRRTPLSRLPLVLISALVAPLEILAALFADNTFEWRGQRLQMERGGQAVARE